MARYRLTPGRRRSILRAQRVSARKRRGGNPVLTRMVLNMAANVVTLGVSGKISGFLYRNKQKHRMRQAAKRRKRRG